MFVILIRLLLCLAVLAAPSMVRAEDEEKTPVILIPGIMGTELYKGDELIWPDVVRLVSNPLDGFLSENLRLDEHGGSIKKIEPGNVIRKMLGTDTFEGLSQELQAQGYVLGESLFFFPYDWRLNLNHTRHLLAETVNQVLIATGSEKVDIIAHSMGGLLSKAYMNEYGTESIRKLIFVGTPHFGAPKAFNSLLTGDIGIPYGLVNASRIKEIAINSPAMHQLLMTHRYFPFDPKPIRKVTDGVTEELSMPQTHEFLQDLGKNASLIAAAESFHGALQLDWLNRKYENIEIYGIVGCKSPTQASYHVDSATGRIIYTEYGSGDGTVPNIGHLVFTLGAYFVPNGAHASLPSMPGVRSLISGLLNGEDMATNLPSGVSKSLALCELHGQMFNWRSPVEVHAYDGEGNHIGLSVDGIVENNIPGASFEVIDGEVYMFLPTDGGQAYDVQAIGTAEGEFDLVISEINNGEYGSSIFYDDVEIETNSTIQMQLSEEAVGQLMLDIDSTGEFEIVDFSLLLNSLEEIVARVEVPNDVPEEEVEVEIEEQEPEPASPVSSGGGGGHAAPVETVSSPAGEVLGELVILLPDGSLVLDSSDGTTVYITGSGGRKYGFVSGEDFLAHGFRFDQLIQYDLSYHEFGGLVGPGDGRHPNGSLVYDGQTIWLINYDRAYGFVNMQDLNSAGFFVEDAVNKNEADKLLDKYVWF